MCNKKKVRWQIRVFSGNKFPLNMYYAYGMWNSFRIDFDPVTGKLWDTENGLVFGDEINLVEPGFNSGYNKIDGTWLRGYSTDQTERHVAPLHPYNLVDFGSKGKYLIPKFTWFRGVGPTAIKFLNSHKEQYLEKDLVGLLTLRWDLKTIMALMITYMSLHSTKHREQYLE
jgi:glucose/arabinose dehydrogenase